MSIVIGLLIVAVVIWQVAVPLSKLRDEKLRCATYPFYRFRDKIIRLLIEHPERATELRPWYEFSNRMVPRTDHFNFGFLSQIIEDFVENFLEGKPPNKRELTELDVELIDLVLETARRNSLLVRLSLTRFGRVILLWPIVRGIERHLRNKIRRLRVTKGLIDIHDRRFAA